MSQVRILTTDVSRLSFSEALDAVSKRLAQGQGGYACFINVHLVTEAARDQRVQQALSDATFPLADGVPLVWVSRLKRQAIGSRVCGPDFMREFIQSRPGVTHAFVGGAPGQAEGLASRFDLMAACYSPPMRSFSDSHAREDWENLLKASGGVIPQVVWVGLGAPKQELWCQAVSRLAPSTMFMAVGAAFDFLTGTKSRAPLWMQKSGLEWFYRLTQEPGRLWKRYLVNNSLFLWYLVTDRLSKGGRHQGRLRE